MTRGKFSREFKSEAVKLVTDRGVSVAQASRDLDLADSALRR
ncbi:transposase [Paracoccus sp. Z118]|nr:transposase [Paracoccus sp. Z118]